MEKLIIVGSGPAGLTAAIYAARANLKPLVIDGARPGGQLMGTSIVENWPGNVSIMGPELMVNMRTHAQHFGARFMARDIVQCDFSKTPLALTTNKQEVLQSAAIIIATGAQPKKLTVPGEETYWGKGVSTCAVCDGALYGGKQVVVVGGGDTALEDAVFLTKFTDQVTVVQMLDKLTASHVMQQRVLNNPKITVLYNNTVSAIEGDKNTVTGISLTNVKTKEITKIPAQGVFIAIGLTPSTQFLKGHVELDQWGFVKLFPNKGGTSFTSAPGVFAAGDAHDSVYRQAITAAASGCMAALDAEEWLAGISS